MDSMMLQPKTEQSTKALSDSGMLKSVLLHVQDDSGLEARLQAALALVRVSGGHLTCLQVTPPVPFGGYGDLAGAYVLSDFAKEIAAHETALRERIETQLCKEDVAWSYQQQTWDPAAALSQAGALADLIILGRFEQSQGSKNQGSNRQTMALFGNLLRTSRTPLLICPNELAEFDPFGPAVVAWNASFEAANALRAALPLLQLSLIHI